MAAPIVYITEAEHVELMNRTLRSGHVVPTAFDGMGNVWIALDSPSSRWALKQLADIRGITLTTNAQEG